MTIACETCGRSAAPAQGAASRLFGPLARTWAEFWRRSRDRRQLGRLLDLDDHLLADIGLTRDEVRFTLGSIAHEDTRWSGETSLHPVQDQPAPRR